MAEQEGKIKAAQTNVDNLRESLGVPDSVAFGEGPQMLMTAETLRKLEGLRIETKAQFVKELTLIQGLTNLPPEKLQQVLPTTTADTILSSLLEQRSFAEQKLVQLKNDFGPKHPTPFREQGFARSRSMKGRVWQFRGVTNRLIPTVA